MNEFQSVVSTDRINNDELNLLINKFYRAPFNISKLKAGKALVKGGLIIENQESSIPNELKKNSLFLKEEIEYQKELFSTLRVKFREYQTKSYFLNQIFFNPPDYSNEQQVSEIESIAKKDKLNLVQSKKEIENSKNHLLEIIENVNQAFETISKHFQEVEQLQNKIRNAEEEIKNYENSTSKLKNVQNIVDEQETKIIELESYIQEQNEANISLNEKITQLGKEISNLRIQRTNIETAVTETIRKTSNINPIFKNMCEWYNISGKLLSNIDSIVSLNYTKPDELEVVRRITLNDNSVYDIIIIIIYKDNNTVDVKLKNKNIKIDDIIEEGKQRATNIEDMISFYIKEICWRVTNINERVIEFQKLKSRYDIKYTDINGAQGNLEIILNDISQTILLFQIDPEYPRTPGCFELINAYSSDEKNENLARLEVMILNLQ
jgi:DNA repair ATPase RecN